MLGINRNVGTTESERLLARIAEHTFLNLWTYPNLYRKQQQHGKGDGKELCDLLVVCGDDVIIFSDKQIEWSATTSVEVAWSRWYRRAIRNSVGQIRGAERWLREFPDRIFLDKDCEIPLPVELPPVGRRRVHGVVIAAGATEACKAYFNDPVGLLMISAAQRGEDRNSQPFLIGDVDPGGPFIHVLDPPAIDLLLRLLDTITDFAIYLNRRARAIRSGRIELASGEDDMVAYYLANVGADGEHDFVRPQEMEWQPEETLVIEPGYFRHFIQAPGFLEKIEADKVSYIWDNLITQFSDNVVAGTSISILGEEPTPASAERALRAMARERRVYRRYLGDSVRTTYDEMIRRKMPLFARIMTPGEGSVDRTCAYVFMILAYPNDVPLQNGYQQYREARVRMLQAYCFGLMSKRRDLAVVVGIGVDAPTEVTGREGGSEDLIAVGKQEWTPEFTAEVEKTCLEYNILQDYRGEGTRVKIEEYPAPPDDPRPTTRQQRRALQRAYAKKMGRRGLRE